MQSNRVFKIILILCVITCNIGCDQVSKNIVRESITENDRISVIDNHFILTRVENTGAALSLGENLNPQLKMIFLKIFPTIILGILLIYLLKSKFINKYRIWAFSFLIGGGIGNIYDRILYDSVTDFMVLYFWKFQTGIFNMADVSVMVGVFIMLVEGIFNMKQTTIGEISKA